jgi:hypothetical protein
METFVYVYAWILGLSVVVRALMIPIIKYPRTTKTSIGQDVFGMLTSIALLVWAIFLLNM